VLKKGEKYWISRGRRGKKTPPPICSTKYLDGTQEGGGKKGGVPTALCHLGEEKKDRVSVKRPPSKEGKEKECSAISQVGDLEGGCCHASRKKKKTARQGGTAGRKGVFRCSPLHERREKSA